MNAVSMYKVTVSYGNHIAIENITFSINEGSFLVIMGPNGAGKTTLLRTILAMTPLIKGFVRIFSYDAYKDSLKIRRMIGYVPQRESVDATVPVLVKDVVLMGRYSQVGLFHSLSREDYRKAREALEMVGLEDLWDVPYIHLSGGQQQRVLIARALVQEPKILLLDEPFSQIDYPSQGVIMSLLRDLKEDEGVTIIAAIHVIDPMLRYIDKILLLNRIMLAYGDPSEVLKEDTLKRAYRRGFSFINLRNL